MDTVSQNKVSLNEEEVRLDLFIFKHCGGGEIRTHGPLTWTTVFKTVALNHSATPPFYCVPHYTEYQKKGKKWLSLGIVSC